MTQIVGVDVGGTFTDLVLFDTETESVKIAKVPSTPENQAFGVMQALKSAGATMETLNTVIHGTTITTNALLERKIFSFTKPFVNAQNNINFFVVVFSTVCSTTLSHSGSILSPLA